MDLQKDILEQTLADGVQVSKYVPSYANHNDYTSVTRCSWSLRLLARLSLIPFPDFREKFRQYHVRFLHCPCPMSQAHVYPDVEEALPTTTPVHLVRIQCHSKS